jgi:hypothetical protein
MTRLSCNHRDLSTMVSLVRDKVREHMHDFHGEIQTGHS